MNAIIMAAGTSSRFAPLSYEKPKGLLKVKGEILIERHKFKAMVALAAIREQKTLAELSKEFQKTIKIISFFLRKRFFPTFVP